MRIRAPLIATLSFLTLLATTACGSEDKSKTDKADKAKDEAKPSLNLQNDTPACRKALECCEKMVEIDKGKATPEDINLSCSGVGMAGDDKTCDDFKKGYAMSIEGKGQPVPDSCK
ncbi:MAG: hypothetical protein HC927_10775 [Deltaproteobacteria bacterium]|nr:hypothetical protein [Deltaproteobacteria bacterium]